MSDLTPLDGSPAGQPVRRFAALYHASTLTTVMAASSAPTPLYRLYQEQWGFSPGLLTFIFGVYAFSLLGALLVAGSLSDHLGRRPVIFAALLVQATAMAVFANAGSVAALIVARCVQGLAAGLATSALSAALLDLDRIRAPLTNSLIPPAGMAIGALGAGVLVAYAPWPAHLVFVLLLGTVLLQSVLIWRMPETVQRRPLSPALLMPRIRVPPLALPAFWQLTPGTVATWSLGGFYMSLMPSLLRGVAGVESPLVGGLAVAVLTASGAAGILAMQRRTPGTMLMRGLPILIAGLAGVLAGAHAGWLGLLFLGSAVAGFGWGASFLGALRSLLPLAGPGERAGLMAAYYISGYLSMSLPAMLAGVLARRFGLLAATDVYGAGVILLALAAFAAVLWPRSGRPESSWPGEPGHPLRAKPRHWG